MDKDMLTTKDVAAMKGVSVVAVAKAIRAGRLAAVRGPSSPIGGQWGYRIAPADAEAWTPILDPHERGIHSGGRPKKPRKKRGPRPKPTDGPATA